MEDILASIRRILSEDEQGGVPATPSAGGGARTEAPSPAAAERPPTPEEEPPGDVLVLDAGMMVPEAPEAAGAPGRTDPAPVAPEPRATGEAQAAPPATAPELTLDQGPLVDAQTRQAAASSVGNLVRTLTAGRAAQVHRGGPTLEDLAREMMRPLLKEWLDRHLPGLVERLVSAEIEKVVRNTGL